MFVKRTAVSPPGSGGFVHFEVVVVECEACAFSAVSRFEADAVAIVERHQARCAKFVEGRYEKGSTSDQPAVPEVHGSRK